MLVRYFHLNNTPLIAVGRRFMYVFRVQLTSIILLFIVRTVDHDYEICRIAINFQQI